MLPSHLSIDDLLALQGAGEVAPALRAWIERTIPDQLDRLVDALREAIVLSQHGDNAQAEALLSVLYAVAEASQRFSDRALALRLNAQVRMIGRAEYREALELYDEALALYADLGDPVGAAITQYTRIWALAAVGRVQEAMEVGNTAHEVLAAADRWLDVARLNNNMAAINGRLGRDAEALALIERAEDAYRRLGPEGEINLAHSESNRSLVLRNLGRFEEALAASEKAAAIAARHGQPIVVARAHQGMALTWIVMGRYNEALAMLDDVREEFLRDGHDAHAVLADLFASDCLLQLRRFPEALSRARRVRALFSDRGTSFEVAQAWLNEAVALSAMGQVDAARDAVRQSRDAFEREGNELWAAQADVELSTLLVGQGEHSEAMQRAMAAARVFERRGIPVGRARALLTAALATDDPGEAKKLAGWALTAGEEKDVPLLRQRAHAVLARLATDEAEAADHLEQAIVQLERLQGRLMVEHRAVFIEDKQSLYEDALLLALRRGDPLTAFEYAERAKSRGLIDLVSHRLHLDVRARSAADEPLLHELRRLSEERNRQYRQLAGEEPEAVYDAKDERESSRRSLIETEQAVTELWHRLLVRNADYARDAALWQVRVEPVQPYLDGQTALVEYFFARTQVIAFVVTGQSLQAFTLPASISEIARLQRYLGLNIRSVPGSDHGGRVALATQARGLLARLYDGLVAPLAEHLEGFTRLIIVPHGQLHYLPFHALHDGQRYLLETREITYLPGSSLLAHLTPQRCAGRGALVAANTWDGRLPYTLDEAKQVAALLDTTPVLDDELTLARVQQALAEAETVHLATHGRFRSDNPLFSGLLLADGWLTTLDVFNLRLKASLVTLSACDTGRHVLGGGDELQGFMRAFLAAGAASLLLTLWPVEDASAASLMTAFYEEAGCGTRKAEALREAQRSLLGGENEDLAHPYFWAPYYLVGDGGPLAGVSGRRAAN